MSGYILTGVGVVAGAVAGGCVGYLAGGFASLAVKVTGPKTICLTHAFICAAGVVGGAYLGSHISEDWGDRMENHFNSITHGIKKIMSSDAGPTKIQDIDPFIRRTPG